MADKVDGGGTCQNATARHSWRFGYMYQVPAAQSPIAGAPPVQNETRILYYCIYCLEERTTPCRVPIVPGVIVQNIIAMQQAAGAPPLLH